MNEQDNQVNRQLYLIDQKIEHIGAVLDEISTVLYFAQDSNGNNLIRSKDLDRVESKLKELRGLPDA